ncbi:hypothetical protein EXU48_20845 [Occultella glacieicola]|uniref:Lipoprotein n=1 Tax=Occultella glacieicola TaxID=2518684 RepID=A0ABY2DYC6_9MICO|nr:hypothetical protein [Occultella glacieicola]TDE89178.1 hypothetical protein EXU48_20845 [Occultella glacieicola]
MAITTLLVSGCSPADSGAGAAAREGTSAPEATTGPSAEAMSDDDLCRAFGDVLTITENADLGLRDGRMEAQEQHGWYRLATRVLGRLPSSNTGAVSQAIADLQAVAPAVPSGASETVEIGSAEWTDASGRLSTACEAAGVEVSLESFTGG